MNMPNKKEPKKRQVDKDGNLPPKVMKKTRRAIYKKEDVDNGTSEDTQAGK